MSIKRFEMPITILLIFITFTNQCSLKNLEMSIMCTHLLKRQEVPDQNVDRRIASKDQHPSKIKNNEIQIPAEERNIEWNLKSLIRKANQPKILVTENF